MSVKLVSSYCFLCYSADNIIYTKTTFVCKKCNRVVSKCDICGYYCGDKCLDMFDKCMSITQSPSPSQPPSQPQS